MPKALVTGAAGVMGARMCARLRAAGFEVRALVLPGDPLRARLDGLDCEVREGNVSDAASLRGVCEGVDVVYHLAAVIIAHDPDVFRNVNLEGTANVVAEAQRSGAAHFVYVSSASVTYPKLTPYADSKLAAERIVREAGVPFTIVRPTLVYEPGGGQELMMFLDYLRRFPVVPFIGNGSALKRPVWADDVVDGLTRLSAIRPQGKTYNFSGGEAISMKELAELLLLHHDRRRPFVSVPVWACHVLAMALKLVSKRPALTSSAIAGIVNDANLDPSEAMKDLGYAPVGVRAGFRKCFPTVAENIGDPTMLAASLAKGQVQ